MRSVPELLERRHHQRRMGGGGISGMFQNLTRSRRLRSMEQKLNGFVAEASSSGQRSRQQSEASACTTPFFPTGGGGGRASLSSDRDPLSTGRHYNLAMRMRSKRPAFHDAVHTKINVELAKLKIESHYLPHKQRSASHRGEGQDADAEEIVQLDFSGHSPPPIPPRQLKQPLIVDAAAATNKTDVAPCKALDVSLLSPPVPPYSPEWARPSTLASSPAPLSPMAASAQQQKSIAAAVAAAAKNRKVGRQWSRVPVTNLSSLMNRPLPDTPKQPALSLSLPPSSDDSTAPMPDKQAPGAIVVSPRHSDRHGLEPKEVDEGASFGSEKLQQQQQPELATGAIELLEAQSLEEQQHCCSCNEALQPESALWQLEQSYCRRCFIRSQCSCTVCAYPIEAGQSFVSLQGTEESADLQARVAPPQDELVRLRLRRRGDTAPEALLYHSSCLSCSAPSHTPTAQRSPGSESMDEQLAALEARWFHHRGRVYCMHDYLLMHGTNCAQCRQIITVRFGQRAGWGSHCNVSAIIFLLIVLLTVQLCI